MQSTDLLERRPLGLPNVGALVRGVQAIRFTAGRVPTSVDGAFVWREVDVSGVSASAPSRR